ncbi:tellurite resistance/C4-dicarboxylate transporter family protein [Steroidobacter denitrificans]|nr:tellurite resistance/C4-dicarboxylate transporter family protein [Steroidobacter denitrificans]
MQTHSCHSNPASSAAATRTMERTCASAVANWLRRMLADLYPGCFAFVMATGIISNVLLFTGHRLPSDLLFAVNIAAYPWLLALTMLRVIRFWPRIWQDLTDPRLVFSFFTLVAAGNVLGVGIYQRGFTTLALAMWMFALSVWLLLIYFSFSVLTFLNTAHRANVVHGGWLIAIVGTESLVILGTLVAPDLGSLSQSMFVLLHMLWGVGLVLYGIFITLFAYRIFFHDVGPDDVTPLLWVVMGAAAISTNAGSTLILAENGMPFLQAMRPFIDGTTLVLWAWGTWWIPLLIILGVWKHGFRRVPLTYTPMFWSLVFPLGMYAAASRQLSLAADFPALHSISRVMVWIALAVWAATASGLALAARREFRIARTT